MFSSIEAKNYESLTNKVENFFCLSRVSILHLKCLTNENLTCVNRINSRSRGGESLIKSKYLDEIIEKTNKFYEDWPSSKLAISTDGLFNENIELINLFIKYNMISVNQHIITMKCC